MQQWQQKTGASMTNRTRPIVCFTTLAVLGSALLLIDGGCAHRKKNPPNVPESATLRSEGRADSVAVTAELGGGMAYLYDVTDKKVVWSGEVYSDQSVALNAKDGTIAIDGRVVHQGGIDPGHQYQFYFDRKPH
jgi:hypothetical protein